MTTGAPPLGGRLPSARTWLGLAAVVGTGVLAAAVAGGLVDPVLVVAGTAGLGTAIAVMLWPETGLIVISVFAVLRLADVATDFHGAPSTFTPLVALLVAAVLVRWLTTGDRPTGAGRIALLAGPFILFAVGSLVWAPAEAGSIKAAEFLVKDGAVAVLAGFLLHRPADLHRVMWTIVIAGGGLATITAVQFLSGAFDNAFLGFAQSEVQNIFEATDDVRISGPIGDPNYYGQLLVMITPLAYERWRRSGTRLGRTAGAWATIACGASTVFTFSRGAAVALAVVGVLMVIRFRPSVPMVVGAIIGVIVLLPLLPPGYVERLTTLDQIGSVNAATDGSIRGRTSVVRAGTAMFSDRPLTGLGYGSFSTAYPDYARDLGIELRSETREAHNLYVEIAAETGLGGIAGFGLLVIGSGVAIRRSRHRFRAAGRGDLDDIGYAIGVGLIAYLLTSVFLHMAFARFAWLLVGVALALPNVAASLDEQEAPS